MMETRREIHSLRTPSKKPKPGGISYGVVGGRREGKVVAERKKKRGKHDSDVKENVPMSGKNRERPETLPQRK